jgi:tetratricopeptide (TPR) repeat protein
MEVADCRICHFTFLHFSAWCELRTNLKRYVRLFGEFPKGTLTNMSIRPNQDDTHLSLLFFCLMLIALLTGCSHTSDGSPAGSLFLDANDFFAQGNYEASLDKYEKAIEKEPETADRFIFEMGIIYSHPANERKSYEKALECFRKIISDYPGSAYRRDSQMMIFQIQNVIIKDHLIAEQNERLEAYRRKIESREHDIITLEKKIGLLQQKVFDLWTEPVDKVLIEKQKRQLTLISKGEAIKTYTIALGANPVGPKERQGDNKTPEGNYIIESRNMHSDYHLSLRISYPNERDKNRAKELGVNPGGDIMIHGAKNDLFRLDRFSKTIDWTEGCIAVTNQEIEEIARLVPDGTPVEIRS